MTPATSSLFRIVLNGVVCGRGRNRTTSPLNMRSSSFARRSPDLFRSRLLSDFPPAQRSIDCWPPHGEDLCEIVEMAATMASGTMPPSQLLRKFASQPRRHDLAIALREIGLVERTPFIIDLLLDTGMRRRAGTGQPSR